MSRSSATLLRPSNPRFCHPRHHLLPRMQPHAFSHPRGIAIRAAAATISSQQRRFAVLKTGHASDYTERTYGGYGKMLANLLKDENPATGAGERWDIFSVIDGDFSFLDNSRAYDGYVITGSAADAHSDEGWVLRLRDALALLHGERKRLLGICFGHQVLARALGGRTGRAEVGWELGMKRLRVDSDAISKLYGVDLSSSLNAIESHRDQVLQVPVGAVVLATSEKTDIEIFAIEDHVLGIQCHPEFTKDVMIDIIQTRFLRQMISAEEANEALKSLEEGREADQEPLKQLCKVFLKGKLQGVI